MEKKPKTKKELVELLATLGSFRAVARFCECSHTTVIKKAKKWGISPEPKMVGELGSNQHNVYVPRNMKMLFIDIETCPNLAEVWGLWKQDIHIHQLKESARMICFSAKFQGQKKVHFYSEHHHGREEMLLKAWELISETDVLVHYNGNKFDIPFLNKEFLIAGMLPPRPSKQLDLYRVAKKHFKLPSYKLDYITSILNLEGKKKHSEGYYSLWAECSLGKKKAWKEMREYNINDVIILENLYYRILPWITNHPNHGIYSGDKVCPNCGHDILFPSGFTYTNTRTYPQFECQKCGTWIRGSKSISGSEVQQTKY